MIMPIGAGMSVADSQEGSMMRLGSIDWDESVFRCLLVFTIGFSSLHAFKAIRHVWGNGSLFLARMSSVLD
jgi:hypothetical protein